MKRTIWTLVASCSVGWLAFASITPDVLEVTLAPGESVAESKDVETPDLPVRADVIFAFDLTGSMGSIIDTAKARALDIMSALEASGVSFSYGVASYMDYPNRYNSCGYNATYGDAGSGDYAYSLDQVLTTDTAGVQAAILSLSLGSGADGPQDYARPFYESYADPNILWRSGAKKVLLNFGDNVPHDCNLNEGVTGGTWSTGGDPGRDEVMGTADDLDLQTVLAGMAANRVTLLEAHTSTYSAAHWDYWTGLTGGQRFLTASGTLVADVVDKILEELTVEKIYGLHLVATAGFESWLASVSPAEYPELTPGDVVGFDLVIQVPLGTPGGDYVFHISATDENGVSYGDQEVTVHVPSGREPPEVTCEPTNKVSNLSRYYRELNATSTGYTCDDLAIYVGDTATPLFVAGPFTCGDVVRISKAAAATAKPGKYGVAAIITVVGQAKVWATDPEGLISLPVICP